MINTLKFQLCKNDNNDSAYTFIKENEFGIKCEAVIWVVMSVVCFVISQFTAWMIIPFMLAMYNLIIAWIKVSEAKYQVKKKSIKYIIEYNINVVFYELQILSKVMTEKGLREKDIENWKKHYIGNILKNKSLHTITAVIEDIKAHFYKITLLEFPTITEKDVRKFIKKESKSWWDTYYPEFKDDLAKNAFGRQRAKANEAKKTFNGTGTSPSTNLHLEQNLKMLGLPSTVRDLKTVKARYYELIRKYHPDAPQNKNKDKKVIQEKIIEINIAYQEVEKYLNNSNRGI